MYLCVTVALRDGLGWAGLQGKMVAVKVIQQRADVLALLPSAGSQDNAIPETTSAHYSSMKSGGSVGGKLPCSPCRCHA